MRLRQTHRTLALLAITSLGVAACGSDGKATDATTAGSAGGPTATTAASAAVPAADLAAFCPATVVIQTDWFPEAEHGSLYELVGEGYAVDKDNKTVTGPLVAGGQDTGIDIQIRTGGPAIGYNPVASTMYTDNSITFGYANTEGQVLQRAETPLVSVVAPLEINPQIILWDPETYPDVETLADLGTEGVTINVFSNGVFSEVFVAQGIWNEDQIDPSYEGSPARFISEDGAMAQQGFASAEPYSYENVFEEWMKPVAFQTLHDAGFQVYSQTLAVREADIEELGPCLKQIVPVFQRAAVGYLAAPDRANAIIVDAVEKFDDFWVYDKGIADFSVKTQKELGLVGNGPDATLGNFDEARVQKVVDQMREAGLEVPEDLVAADLFTNEFIDTSVGL